MTNLLLKARELYNTAHQNKVDCAELIRLTANSENVVMMAYHQGALMISTKYLLNPFQILKIFNPAKKMLEELASENFGNVEIHYVRYTIQMNTPAFVGYNKSKVSDRKILSEFLMKSEDELLVSHILFYLKNTNDLTGEERAFFHIQ
jgi:hypothetical protein